MTTTIFPSGYQSCNRSCFGPFCWQNPCSGCNIRIDLIAFLEYTSFQFFQTLSKSLRFTRFGRGYVNHPVVVLTNHSPSYTAFLLDVRCSKWSRSFFFSFLFPVIVHLRCFKHTCCSNVVNSKVGWQRNKCEIVINISILTVGVKHSIVLRTTFSPTLHSVSRGENFGMFVHSATLISWFSHFFSKTGGLG